jgi:DNA-binding Lrp family transcriptional regulator
LVHKILTMEVLRALKDVEGVEKAEMVYGHYDIVDRVERDSVDSKRIITKRIRPIKKVATTTTMMAAKA